VYLDGNVGTDRQSCGGINSTIRCGTVKSLIEESKRAGEVDRRQVDCVADIKPRGKGDRVAALWLSVTSTECRTHSDAVLNVGRGYGEAEAATLIVGDL